MGKEGPTEETPESKLHPFYFKGYVKKCVSKLSNDECYSQNTRDEFLNYDVNFNDTNYTYQLVRKVIGDFNGDGEGFAQNFINVYRVKKLPSKNYHEDPQLFLLILQVPQLKKVMQIFLLLQISQKRRK